MKVEIESFSLFRFTEPHDFGFEGDGLTMHSSELKFIEGLKNILFRIGDFDFTEVGDFKKVLVGEPAGDDDGSVD